MDTEMNFSLTVLLFVSLLLLLEPLLIVLVLLILNEELLKDKV